MLCITEIIALCGVIAQLNQKQYNSRIKNFERENFTG